MKKPTTLYTVLGMVLVVLTGWITWQAAANIMQFNVPDSIATTYELRVSYWDTDLPTLDNVAFLGAVVASFTAFILAVMSMVALFKRRSSKRTLQLTVIATVLAVIALAYLMFTYTYSDGYSGDFKWYRWKPVAIGILAVALQSVLLLPLGSGKSSKQV